MCDTCYGKKVIHRLNVKTGVYEISPCSNPNCDAKETDLDPLRILCGLKPLNKKVV